MRTDLREKIIQSSLLLFEKKGFHGVTVNEIVADVGTSKGGFYHHFTSKDELLYVIHDTFITYVLEKAMYAINMYESPTRKLRAIIKDFVKVFDIYKPHISVFYQESIYLKHEYEVIIKEKRDCFKKLIFHTIKEGQECGEFRKDLPVEITGMAILGMVNWTYKWYHPTGKNTIEEISEIFVELILHAIIAKEKWNHLTYNELSADRMNVSD
ncbi:TetR/AcrR family transcriptional regulator [Virgibacillus proomii]|uniref:TetR/AcrR family transcriptional regulator n=1 Tax=Virgibacillus proomii TaxID=84407 RepID=UPI001C126F51|nr:TetR/AcrR family transcriptional regulator [Virgibacillus proomii]MBU5266385.1 TetR/AcrR family transcriptional regulator [Virgibacillus proomii]